MFGFEIKAARIPLKPHLASLTRKIFRWLWLEGLVAPTRQRWLGSGAQPGGPFALPEKISKHCIAILTFAEAFKVKMKFYLLTMFKKSLIW